MKLCDISISFSVIKVASENGEQFEATCLSYPEIKGYGETEQEATTTAFVLFSSKMDDLRAETLEKYKTNPPDIDYNIISVPCIPDKKLPITPSYDKTELFKRSLILTSIATVGLDETRKIYTSPCEALYINSLGESPNIGAESVSIHNKWLQLKRE